MIDLSGDAWAAVAALGTAAIAAVGGVAAERSRRQAKRAAVLSEPTSNGFAGRVIGSLARLERQGERTDQRLDEIARQVHVVGNRLTAHLDHHAGGTQ